MGMLLVLAETDGAKILPATLPVISFAQQWAKLTSGTFAIAALGGQMLDVETLRGYGASAIYLAADAQLLHPTADKAVAVLETIVTQTNAVSIAGASATFGRDMLPRLAGKRDLPMLSDVLSIANDGSGLIFRRPMNAGNFFATVQIDGDNGVFSIRTTAFGKPEQSSALSPIENVTIPALPTGTVWKSLEAGEQKRPELTNARVVVSGGRPLRDAETFERLLGGLADALGGAVGATRAAVDSGIAPNELQVGQTGKVVAPELYIAAGVSGSVQHLAGMKESKVIVAINSDPDAPIFEVADYGLVADLHTAIPELTAKRRQ